MYFPVAARRVRARRSIRVAFGLMAMLTFGSCSGATSPTGKIVLEAQRNRARWRAQHLDSYT